MPDQKLIAGKTRGLLRVRLFDDAVLLEARQGSEHFRTVIDRVDHHELLRDNPRGLIRTVWRAG
jgi:hypothetical protein